MFFFLTILFILLANGSAASNKTYPVSTYHRRFLFVSLGTAEVEAGETQRGKRLLLFFASTYLRIQDNFSCSPPISYELLFMLLFLEIAREKGANG